MPLALPITVATAAARPQAIARAIVKRTDGPGARMINIVAIRYSQRRDGINSEVNTRTSYGLLCVVRWVLILNYIDSIYLVDRVREG
jgi:hypothetical protein